MVQYPGHCVQCFLIPPNIVTAAAPDPTPILETLFGTSGVYTPTSPPPADCVLDLRYDESLAGNVTGGRGCLRGRHSGKVLKALRAAKGRPQGIMGMRISCMWSHLGWT